MTSWRPLPRDVPAAPRPPGFPPESPVPSMWFLTTSTVSSAWKLAGLLHPATDHEVRRVSCSCRPDTAGEGGPVRSRDPRGAHRTPRRMFPVDSRSASPRSLPSCRWRAACGATVTPARCRVDARVVADGCVGFRALLRRRVRDLRRTVADADAIRSFLGFVSLQGPF
jgi:hypothetical protein